MKFTRRELATAIVSALLIGSVGLGLVPEDTITAELQGSLIALLTFVLGAVSFLPNGQEE